MSAVKDGDEWVLNGQKIWTSLAQYSHWGILPARSDPSAAKHAGMTYFIVDMKAPGIEIRPIRQINGASNFTEVFFSDVRVRDSHRVGAVGDGWRVAITTLMHERAAVGAGGRTGPGIDDLLRLAQEVELNGRPAIEDAGVRQRIGDFYVRMAGLRCTGYRTLTALSRGQTPGPEASIMKLIGATLGQQVASCGIDLQGLAGSVVVEESGWQEAYLEAPGLRLAGGSDETLLNIMAERVLRLPPEPRMDKDLAFRDIPTGPPDK
jgi:alkylation response protein AidB-like acyl-CoA dehydrogenase